MKPSVSLAILGLVGACDIEAGIGFEAPSYPVGAPPPVEDVTQVDEILQVTTPMVDILWTIDNSTSMQNEQDDLVANFGAFMNYFLDSGLDYQIGVTSTDIDNNYNGSKGKLVSVGGMRWIDTETDDPIGVFSTMASLGTDGSGTEKGLGGTYECLETQRNEANAGFYRDVAAVHTIVISDEPDQTQASVITQPEFVEWYSALKPEADQRTFSSIVDVDGQKYKSSTTSIGGIFWDINDEDWPQVLERLGVQAAGLKREYFLSQRPVPGTLIVSVRDSETGAEREIEVATFDPTTNLLVSGEYVYETNRNSVVFQTYIPNPLSTIVLTYTVLASQQSQSEVLD